MTDADQMGMPAGEKRFRVEFYKPREGGTERTIEWMVAEAETEGEDERPRTKIRLVEGYQ